MIETLTASVFNRFMESGRSSPMLATCVTHGDEDIDIVVKLNGAMELGPRAAAAELIASAMATKMGIECPKPYLVRLLPQFVEAVISSRPESATRLRQSIGWNFGSKMLRDATIWPRGAMIPATMLSDAMKIFAFDGLTQNPDRREENPNLMMRGDRLCAIDHECAFLGFLLPSFLPAKEPWTLGHGDYMERHALRHGLRGKSLNWKDALGELGALNSEFFDSIRESLPAEWNGTEDLNIIEGHVTKVIRQVSLFEIELQRRIA